MRAVPSLQPWDMAPHTHAVYSNNNDDNNNNSNNDNSAVVLRCRLCSAGLYRWTCVLPVLHTRLTTLCPGLPGWAGTREVKPVWILLKQETVSGSGISWAICKSAPRSRQITTPAPHHSVFYRSDALPAAQPTVSKHCVVVIIIK